MIQSNDRPFIQLIQSLKLSCQVHFLPNPHFLWSEIDFRQWAKNRRCLLMEDFYREGRKRFNVLMDGDQPMSRQWNFDQESRKPPRGQLNLPTPLEFEPDDITQAVIQQVQNLKNIPLYGELLSPYLNLGLWQ